MAIGGFELGGVALVFPINGNALKIVVLGNELLAGLVVGRAVALERLQGGELAGELGKAIVACPLRIAGAIGKDVERDVAIAAGHLVNVKHVLPREMHGVDLGLRLQVHNRGTVRCHNVAHGRMRQKLRRHAVEGTCCAGDELHARIVDRVERSPGFGRDALVGGEQRSIHIGKENHRVLSEDKAKKPTDVCRWAGR